MASSLAMKNLLASNRPARSIFPFRPVAASRFLFTTKDCGMNRTIRRNVYRLEPYPETKSGPIMKWLQDIIGDIFGYSKAPLQQVHDNCPWMISPQHTNKIDMIRPTDIETFAGGIVRVYMPGLEESDLKLRLDENVLRIQGARQMHHTVAEDGGVGYKCTIRFDPQPAQIQLRMSRGILKILVSAENGSKTEIIWY